MATDSNWARIIAAFLLITGCSSSGDPSEITGEAVEVATFEGRLDSDTGTLVVESVALNGAVIPLIAGRGLELLEALDQDRDGTRLNAPDDWVELPTMRSTDNDVDGNPYADPGVCDTNYYCGRIRLDSYFQNDYLNYAYVEITEMTTSSNRAQNELTGGTQGLNAWWGLFRYGMLEPWNGVRSEPGAGRNERSSSVREWRFDCPGGTCSFNFKGRIMAEKVAVGGPTPITAVGLTSSGNAVATTTSPSATADGRFVAFESTSSALSAGDTNGASDVFLLDRWTGEVSNLTSAGNGASDQPKISADGSTVVFRSTATNLVAGDVNGVADIFAYRRSTASFELVSVHTDGTQGNSESRNPDVSDDGSRVVFESASSTLTDDARGTTTVFLRDRGATETRLIPRYTNGTAALFGTHDPAISGDGTCVAYRAGDRLVGTDTNGKIDVYVTTVSDGQPRQATVATDGSQANDHTWTAPSLSQGCEYVAFSTAATNLDTLAPDLNGLRDVFVRNLGASTTTRVSIDTLGGDANGLSDSPAVASDGRVYFRSDATDLIPSDTNSRGDIFVYSAGSLSRVSVNASGSETSLPSSNPRVTGGDAYLSFVSGAGIVDGPGGGGVYGAFLKPL